MATFKLSIRHTFYLLLLAGAVEQSNVCKKIDDCSCTRKNGRTMSLKPVDKNPGPRFKGIESDTVPPSKFSWNPCTTFTDGTCEDVLVCQNGGPSYLYPVAKSAKSFVENDDGSITLTYTGVTYDSYERVAVIKLVCNKSQSPGVVSSFSEEKVPGEAQSQYKATFSSQYVCDEGPVNPGEKSLGGLSIGSILLIVFFPLLFIYLIGGLLYSKYHKGVQSFPEIVPNHSFWADFPFLVKDGCVFTFQGIAGCCKSLCMKLKGDSYANI